MRITSWKKMFESGWPDETLTALVIKGGDEAWSREFDSGYGSTQGAEFTAWSDEWVYFPICYDGREWIGRAPRNPGGEAMVHQGGG